MPRLEAAVNGLAEALPGVAVGPLVAREPALLRVADANALLDEARRLMPVRGAEGRARAGTGHRLASVCICFFAPHSASHRSTLLLSLLPATRHHDHDRDHQSQHQGRDPVALVAADPTAFLDMEALALPSTLEHN